MKQITPDNGKTYEHPSQLLSDESFRNENPLSDKEFQKLLRLGLIERHYRTAQNIDQIYQGINVEANAESLIQMYGFKGGAADTIRKQYKKLGVRLDELIANGEHKSLFFMGKQYEMHSLLFKNIGRMLIFELLILVVLITAFITNYEFEHRTHLIS